MLFDSHCHLTDQRFAEDRDDVLSRARQAGVNGMVTIASDLSDARSAADLAERNGDVWATAGVHPHVAADAGPDDLDRIGDLLRSHPRMIAVGETGLDYHYDNSPRARQRELLRKHGALAAELGLPLVVHTRDADDDTRAFLRDAGGEIRGVLHCFTGGTALLEAGIEAGWYISYSGIATFDGFAGREGVRIVPRDRLLIETDAPYLAPVPHRGHRNEPAHVAHVAASVAGIRDEDPDEVGRYTARNARTFYDLPAPSGVSGAS